MLHVVGDRFLPYVCFGFLKISVPPELKFVSVNKTVNQTGRLGLFCNATGIPAPNISWTKAGSTEQIPTGKHLIIKSARKEDSGTYTCKASNKAGNTTAQIHVNVQCKYVSMWTSFIFSSVGL